MERPKNGNFGWSVGAELTEHGGDESARVEVSGDGHGRKSAGKLGKGRERRGEPETERRHRIGGGREERGSPLFIGEWRGRNFRAKIIRGGSERGTEGQRENGRGGEQRQRQRGRLTRWRPAERARIFA